jgi:hypothetical protein
MSPEREAAIKAFFDRERDLPASHEVLVTKEPVPACWVIDVDGEAIFEGAPQDIEGFLFFVDEEPSANWSHRCRYVFHFKSGGRAIAHREWPPNETIYDKFEKVERP